MNEHKGHKIGTIFGHSGLADYCLDCSKVLDQLTMKKREPMTQCDFCGEWYEYESEGKDNE